MGLDVDLLSCHLAAHALGWILLHHMSRNAAWYKYPRLRGEYVEDIDSQTYVFSMLSSSMGEKYIERNRG
jgi:fatty acid desaturase